jgi:hypothetical protein
MILTTEDPAQEHVWIALAKPEQTRWHAAKVVWVRESSYGLVKVGLAFKARNFFNVLRIKAKGRSLLFAR